MRTITYAEHYPHYMGDMNASFTMTEAEFTSLKSKFGQGKLSDDDYDALRICTDARAGKTVYAFDNLLINSFKKIMKALNTTGTWSGEWEEGSFALSVHGLSAAKAAISKIEAQYIEDDMD
jgi:hypothetical protein